MIIHGYLTYWTETKSKPAFESWFNDKGIQHICKLISKEMESVIPMLKMNIKDVTPQFIEHWQWPGDVNEIVDPVAVATPIWSKILHAATEPQKKNTVSNPDMRNHPTVSYFTLRLT